MIDWEKVYNEERNALGVNIKSSCIGERKGKKVSIYKSMQFPILNIGLWIAYNLMNESGLKQYTYCFVMADNEAIPVIDFMYDGSKYDAALCDRRYLQDYDINQDIVIMLLGIIRKGFCVYKYTCNEDGIVKYVGISNNLQRRYEEHKRDELKGHDWTVSFIDGLTKTDAEILESYFISYYDTGKYYNKQKTIDGISKYLSIPETEWRYFIPGRSYQIVS